MTPNRRRWHHQHTADGQEAEGNSIDVGGPGPAFLGMVEMQKVHLAQARARHGAIMNNMPAAQVDEDRAAFDKQLEAVRIGTVAAFELTGFTETGKNPLDGSCIHRVAGDRADIGFDALHAVARVPIADMIDRHPGDDIDQRQADAEEMTRRLAAEEGIFAGVSSGGSVAAALRLSEEVENAVIVAIICDRGDRYLSTGIFPAD